jgi:CrcB protein
MKLMLMRCLAIGAAGFVGAVSRYLVAILVGRFRFHFPLGTFCINVSGCLILGWFLTYCGMRNVSDVTRLAIGTGFVGAYTTFSTFIYETNMLASEGARIEAVANVVGSLVVGGVACWLGVMLARWT